LVFFFLVLLQEGVQQDSQEQVQQNEVAQEDPSDVEDANDERVLGASHRVEQH
jgi:hypothetical protein